jgi:hypothetical protein
VEISKQLQDLVVGGASLEKQGVEAYRHGDYARCIQIMNEVVDVEKGNWQARLYLAMSHYAVGEVFLGAMHFRYLEQNCPDETVRAKSQDSLKSMEPELKPKVIKRMGSL